MSETATRPEEAAPEGEFRARHALLKRLADAIADGNPATALRGLRQSLVLETATALAILAVVAWLGTLEPIMAYG